MTTLVLIAKEPVPGTVKTRLSPPLTLDQAAEIAAACIQDTAAVIAGSAATRRVLFFQGSETLAGTHDLEVIAQPTGTLDERLAFLFDVLDGPTLLIGMDTPQLTPADVAPALEDWPDDVDAWFGPATDGGFWALGMRDPRGELIRGVPMSRHDTGAIQLERLRSAGLRVAELRELTDIDTIAEARGVARRAPHLQFAAVLRSFEVNGRAAS